jgi:uncharacterized protein (TIRG00374 family)
MKRLWKLRYLVWLALPPLLFWVLRTVPFAEIRSALSSLGIHSIAILILLNLAILILFNSRWWLILRAQGYSLPYSALVGYRLAAFALSYFTPGTQFGGEPLQVYLLQRRHQVPGTTALAAVTLDKLFEMLTNFTFLTVGLVLALSGGLFAGLANALASLLIAIWLSLLVYMAALWSGKLPLTALTVKLQGRAARPGVIGRFSPYIASAERQISSFFRSRPLVILWIMLLSGLMWALLLFEYWLTLHFLGSNLTLIQAIGALTAARLAFLTPLPGGLGALEASQVFAMQALGLHPALGISVSLLIRARDLTLGALGLWLVATFSRTFTSKPLPFRAGD